MVMFDVFAITGDFEQQEDSTHVVSMWYIPYGYKFDCAEVKHFFYSNKKYADEFAKRWDSPPEMAMVLTIEEYLEIKRRVAENEKRRAEYGPDI